MTQLEKVNIPGKAQTITGFVMLSRLLVMFFAATVCFSSLRMAQRAQLLRTRSLR